MCQQPLQRWVRLILWLWLVIAIWLFIWVAKTANAQAIPALCSSNSAIPATECAALVELYQATQGNQWLQREQWLTVNASVTPCDWFGVTCQAGHVTQLGFASNRLQGRLPNALAAFTHLQTLTLTDNLLAGLAPPALCELLDTLQNASFDYNLIEVENLRVRRCLDQLDPDWQQTQTTPPLAIQVTAVTSSTIQLSWTPISYTTNGGTYEIALSATPDGAITPHGLTTDLNSLTYTVDHLLPGMPIFIHIRSIVPAGGAQSFAHTSRAALRAVMTKSDADPSLFLVYFAADNDLSSYVETVLQRLTRGTSFNPNVQVFFLADELGDHNSKLYAIANGAATATTVVSDVWGRDELDTTDPAVLAWFLKYGRSQINASNTIVALLGHGAGLTPEFANQSLSAASAQSDPAELIPMLPRDIDHSPSDVTDNGGFLSTIDYAQALAAATDNGGDPFDVVFFDQCFQGNLDVVYELRAYADVFIASPNYAWLSAPYDRYLPLISPLRTAEQIAAGMVQIYQRSLSDANPNAIVWLRSADIPAIANAANALSEALLQALLAGIQLPIERAALASKYVDTTMCGAGNLHLGPPDELLGTGSFASNLQERFAAGDPFGVHLAATNLLNELGNVHRSAVGRPYLAPAEFWDYDDGLTMLAPLLRRSGAGVAWRASIYTSTAPLHAVWASDPTQTVLITTAFAAVNNGQWDEFLSHWYTNPLTPTVGERCNYVPPVLISADVTETLALTIENATLQASNVDTTLLALTWSATANPTAVDYWVLAKRSDNQQERLIASVPLTQTTLTVAAPPDTTGVSYELRVVAQTIEGVTVAESNVAVWKEEEERVIFLPWVSR